MHYCKCRLDCAFICAVIAVKPYKHKLPFITQYRHKVANLVATA